MSRRLAILRAITFIGLLLLAVKFLNHKQKLDNILAEQIMERQLLDLKIEALKIVTDEMFRKLGLATSHGSCASNALQGGDIAACRYR